MFCPLCGKESLGICMECYLKKKPASYDPVNVVFCPVCANVNYRNENLSIIEFESKFTEIIKKHLEFPENLEVTYVNTGDFRAGSLIEQFNEYRTKSFSVDIKVGGVYKPSEAGWFERDSERSLNQIFEIPITIKVNLVPVQCLMCSRKSGGYYEAVIQVRDISCDILSLVDRILDKIFALTGKDYITRIDNTDSGIDIYLISAKQASAYEKEFREHGFSIKRSSKLVGMKDGKDLYRHFLSVRAPKFREDDIIEYNGNFIRILKIGRTVEYIPLEGKRKKNIKILDIESIEPAAKGTDAVHYIYGGIEDDTGKIKLEDKDKRYSFDINKFSHNSKNLIENLKIGDKIKIYKINGVFYAV